MRSVALAALAAVLAAACAGCGSSPVRQARAAPAPHFAGAAIPPDAPAADFALRDQNGHLVRLSAQRGRVVFIAFLYSHCTDVWPLLASMLNGAVRSVGTRASSVQIIAVSVDPVGDTPRQVRRFVRARRLGPEFHYLIGTRAQLAPIWQAYNILVELKSPERISHSAPVFLLDAAGRPRVFFAPPPVPGAFAHDLRLLLLS